MRLALVGSRNYSTLKWVMIPGPKDLPLVTAPTSSQVWIRLRTQYAGMVLRLLKSMESEGTQKYSPISAPG